MEKKKGSQDVKIHERGKCRAYDQTDDCETEEECQIIDFCLPLST
jgi:hypothetical protein